MTDPVSRAEQQVVEGNADRMEHVRDDPERMPGTVRVVLVCSGRRRRPGDPRGDERRCHDLARTAPGHGLLPIALESSPDPRPPPRGALVSCARCAGSRPCSASRWPCSAPCWSRTRCGPERPRSRRRRSRPSPSRAGPSPNASPARSRWSRSPGARARRRTSTRSTSSTGASRRAFRASTRPSRARSSRAAPCSTAGRAARRAPRPSS